MADVTGYHDDELVGICTECASEQRDSYMNKNPFFQQGKPVSCQYCGGVVVIGKKSDRKKILAQVNRQRGLA